MLQILEQVPLLPRQSAACTIRVDNEDGLRAKGDNSGDLFRNGGEKEREGLNVRRQK